MSTISAVLGSTVRFDGGLWVGVVASVGDVDINKAMEGKV